MKNDEVYQFLKRDYFDSDFCFQIEKNSLSWDVGLHFHDFFEIEFFLSGSASLVLNNRQYKLSRGCMHLLTPADFHLYHLEKGMECQYVNLRFDDSLLSAELLQILYACPTALLARMEGAAFDQVYREIQLLMEENRRRETGYRIIIRGGLERICLLLLRSTAQQQDLLLEKTNALDPKIQAAVSFIQKNFRRKIAIGEVAAIVNLSANYFSNYFSSVMGTSFSNYVKDLRLQYAMNLLQTSDLNINEISYESGFKTLSNFTSAFKARYGHSPKHYQHAARVQAP